MDSDLSAPSLPPAPVALPELRDELLLMQERQRQLSDYLQAALFRSVPIPAERARELTRQAAALTSKHGARLREVFRRYGWPAADLVGPEASSAAFNIAQSANLDPDFQQVALDALDAALRAGAPVACERAFMTDCVRVGKGLPQLYGTSLRVVDGDVVPTPIEAPEHVDERRAGVGLPPLADHLAQTRALYESQALAA
jgi:hypothetical protein